MKRFIKYLGIIFSTVSILSLISPISASATTKEDVIAVARKVGMPENLVQSYISLGANIQVTSAQCDKAIAKLYEIYGTTNDRIKDDFNVDISSEPSELPKTTIQSATTQDINTVTTQQDTSMVTTVTIQTIVLDSQQDDNIVSASTTQNNVSDNVIIDNYQSPIDESDFISMSYDEKIEFVQSLPQEEQTIFMNNLTTAERNSIIKQMNIDSKTDIVNAIVEAGKSMGYNFSIDELSGDNISLSMRDSEGTLIGVTRFGTTVDDTGKNYTKLILVMVSIISMSGYGLFKISKKVG